MEAAALPHRRRLHVRRAGGGSGRSAARSPARPAQLPSSPGAAAAICRICWAEADSDVGGALLSPCRCRGSSQFVHQRCLLEWMAANARSKGAEAAAHCDICRGRYSLPPGLPRPRDPLPTLARRHAAAAWAAVLASPAGPAVQMGQAVLVLAASSGALMGAWGGVTCFSRTFWKARMEPRLVLPLLPGCLAGMAIDAVIADGTEPSFYLETLSYWAVGWAVDALARLAQAVGLSIICLFSCGHMGVLRAAAGCLRAPLWPLRHLVRVLVRGAAGAVGLAAALRRGAGRGPRRGRRDRGRWRWRAGGGGGADWLGEAGRLRGWQAGAGGEALQQQFHHLALLPAAVCVEA
eukprot:scaffold2.g7102.t1